MFEVIENRIKSRKYFTIYEDSLLIEFINDSYLSY